MTPKKTNNAWQSLEQSRQVPATAELKALSGLPRQDIERLARAWEHLSAAVRQEIIQRMDVLKRENFELDFSDIFRFALGDEDAQVRIGAIEGLDEVEDVRLVPRYVRILEEDPVADVRATAARALARFVLMGELQKIRPQPFEQARQALNRAHGNAGEAPEVQRAALEAMAYTGLDGVPERIAAAYETGDAPMRISAVLAMGRSADKRWAGIVQQELDNPDPAMRFEATRACGELMLAEATRDLVALVEDVEQAIQTMALWALGQIGGNLARRTIERHVHAEDEAMQTAARAALQELEFLHGDLATFFGPPTDFDGESDLRWDDEDDEGWGDLALDDEDEELWP